MNLRESFEEREFQELSPYAAHSRNSRGRDRYEPECDIRTVYQRDRDRILHSKAFRRMKDKTQVFLAAQGDHYRTRLTHTLEVSQIARTIARALNLNEDLTEAIALGHDLGHTPFGHSGEAALNAVHPGGFRHAEQSVRVVEVLEKEGQGLNLTWEVRDGILNHRTAGKPSTLEGQVVRLCDKIAYSFPVFTIYFFLYPPFFFKNSRKIRFPGEFCSRNRIFSVLSHYFIKLYSSAFSTFEALASISFAWISDGACSYLANS